MPTSNTTPLYRNQGVGLLRAAAIPLHEVPLRWPNLVDTEMCKSWLSEIWSRPDVAEAIGAASPGLATRVQGLRENPAATSKQVRRATLATVRYLLRAVSRHTPFGLFAGVAPVALLDASSSGVKTRWGGAHRVIARVDTSWLADVIDQLEARPELVKRLDVVFTDLAAERGLRLEAPHGPAKTSIRRTRVVDVVREAASMPISFGELVTTVLTAFPQADPAAVNDILVPLIHKGLIITCLRAPMTITDPLEHLVGRLRGARADTLAETAPVLRELEAIHSELVRHNQAGATRAAQVSMRVKLSSRMRTISLAGRVPLGLDLRLDVGTALPELVVNEIERAADVLVRLSNQPTGQAVWHEYYTAFCARYGTGTLVPLADVVDPDAGLGFPAGYLGSPHPMPADSGSPRHETLLTLAWNAVVDRADEVVLTDEMIDALTVGGSSAQRRIPPHVELAARIQATGPDALQRGDYTFTVAPGRSAGTFTSRFTGVIDGSELRTTYAAMPTAVEGALPVQLSFRPVFPNAENVSRVPTYLPHVLPLGEHGGSGQSAVVRLDDLAVTATHHGLHLVSRSRNEVVEPQVFHALALDKQAPPLARFLAHLPRALTAAWHEFDWGPHAGRLPFLPRVRYRHAVLSPARWRLGTTDLPRTTDSDQWRTALEHWRLRLRCPSTVELRDGDRSLRLTLDEPVHAEVLRTHLARHGQAILGEVADQTMLGWAGGHVHEIAVPLASTRPPTPSPHVTALPLVTNSNHGHLPGTADWLYAKLYTHPDRVNEIVAHRLPQLLETTGSAAHAWYIRYRSPQENDHLRLRLRTSSREEHLRAVAAVGEWAQQLRHDGFVSRLVLDTYFPETGRYGPGPAMEAAEEVFIADSTAVSSQLRQLPDAVVAPTVLAAIGMIAIADGFLDSRERALRWLLDRPAPGTADRHHTASVIRLVLAENLRELPGWTDELTQAWKARAAALAAYRKQLSAEIDADAVLESLLHMHHNRVLGVDRVSEASCRRMARQAAVAWHARGVR
ncbi:thiopeptide-type bacteriocin biosynthesis protein [Saccharothrix carnea]|uniref:Thiopeptide-type bacteriocin biosynthesis protein n=1 Tax=Saccharothrix carnea TaxID=1280637 RepID=A0A2P8I1Z3_SACCR|nr:lantibiotic dehydratase [Saccharothrix carnea]PSL52484.1 thiopeptide-type bacteriocin biosynthesis protein [Saccharothrix carnea]